MALLEISDVSSLSEAAIKWVEFYVNRKENKAKKENEAIKSLMISLDRTAVYMKSVLDNAESKSDTVERELSECWYSTSILVREYNAELAERCFFKGIYWSNNSRFTEQEIIDKKMKLHHIEMDVAKASASI
ncbi:hypothetical protein KUK86_004501 [Vibrio parahaemolyticus]|uniref:hypothetical protein n=1 Tax=Vibrio parahaemolyticus TaxID=670 RepID=UPI002362A3FC|nr:hypothetical protein [Vibrio parahaemolyticus]EHR7166334.1 hypothetical protein [Vibrio parahaemolyticus]